jgi:hypothetical protein
MRFKLFLAALALSASPLTAQSPDAPFLVRERNEAYQSLQDAVNAIGGGTGTIVIAPGTYRDCAVQEAGRVTFTAAKPGTVIFNGGICQGQGDSGAERPLGQGRGPRLPEFARGRRQRVGHPARGRRPHRQPNPCSATARAGSSPRTT